jgi:branched-chain amino acid transport system ATP-binding protein
MILTAETIAVRYRNGALGVSDVSLEADAGEIVVILGPNGAGKTTTVRAITGFSKAEGAKVVHGSVTLFGRDTTNTEPSTTTSLGVGFVPERRKIFPNMSVGENLAAVGRRPSRARRAAISERIDALFPMLAHRHREMAGRLSGGQQQMLAIARSLMAEARLLVIDEMTLGLHQSMQAPLFDVVKTIASEGTAVVIVDESTSQALHVADRCYLLNGGRVLASGPPETFIGSELLVAGYVGTT